MTLQSNTLRTLITAGVFVVGSAAYLTMSAQGQAPMSFFITSAGSGDGANLGGLAGADKICQTLGDRCRRRQPHLARVPERRRRRTVSRPSTRRDRIGKGPWSTPRACRSPSSVADLHSDNNKLGKENSLTEKGAVVNGRGDTPNTHDMLTGSNADGTLSSTADNTCGNWTKNGDRTGTARLGHFDKQGGGDAPTSWNSAHHSRGCSQPNLVATGGAGLFYCFAIN